MASNKLPALPNNRNFRDDIERREHEQAEYFAKFFLEADNLVIGPETWFRDSPWGDLPIRGCASRLAEKLAQRTPPPEVDMYGVQIITWPARSPST